MIKDIDALVAYTRRKSESLASLAKLNKRLSITRPGCTPEVIRELRRLFPGLPATYFHIVKAVDLEGVSLGGFELTPFWSPGMSLVQCITLANDVSCCGMARQNAEYGTYAVAALEADMVSVVFRADFFKIGQVVLYEHDHPKSQPGVLADSFEQFLLIAGNLDEILGSRESPDDWDVVYRRFGEYLEPFIAGRRDNMAATWARVIG